MIEVSNTEEKPEVETEEKPKKPLDKKLKLNDLRQLSTNLKKVEIESLGGYILMRGLTGQESIEYDQEDELIKKQPEEKRAESEINLMCKQLARCTYDADGQRLFSENEDEAAKQIMSLPSALTKQLHQVWQQLTMIPDIVGLAKNLQAVTQGVSSSVSVHC